MNIKTKEKDKNKNRILILILILLLLFGLAFLYIWKNKQSMPDENADLPIYAKGTFEYNDVLYKQKSNTNTLLLSASYDDKADFIMLLVIDNINKEILPIQIKRSTMCDYTKLDEFGKIKDKVYERIDDSYSYGNDPLSSLINLKDAVSNLLCNVRIDYYLGIDLKDAENIMENLDNVEVVLRDDYIGLEKEHKSGEKIVVYKDNISKFVIGTSDEDIDTIEDRQALFLSSLILQYQDKEKSSAGYTAKAFNQISNYCIFNSNDIVTLINKFVNYKILNRISYNGSYEDLKYYPNIYSVIDLCLNNIYEK